MQYSSLIDSSNNIFKILIIKQNQKTKYQNMAIFFQHLNPTDLFLRNNYSACFQTSQIIKRLTFLRPGHFFLDGSAYRKKHFYTQWNCCPEAFGILIIFLQHKAAFNKMFFLMTTNQITGFSSCIVIFLD